MDWPGSNERKQREEKKVILGIEGILRQAVPELCPGRQSWGPRRSHAFSPRLCAELQRKGMDWEEWPKTWSGLEPKQPYPIAISHENSGCSSVWKG